MKVMHLLQSPHFSGAENVVCQIIKLFKNDKDIEMIYCSQDGSIRDALEERNIQFFPLYGFTVDAVKKAIREIQPDIIHAHDMRASLFAALTCKNIPLVSHIHNNAFDSRGFSFKSCAYLLAGLKAKKIFWVSQSAFKGYCFHSFFKAKSEVLYNIIDIDELYERTERDTNLYRYDVIFLGRLSEPKNPLRIVDVLKIAALKIPDIQAAVVGTGELEQSLKEYIRLNNMENRIELLGYKSNPLKILRDAKLMIMTSLWEGTPMCALEAMALGTPIVSTPVDGLKDLIENDVNGYLSNDNHELGKKIVEYLADKDKLLKMSQKQIECARKWNDKIKYKQRIVEAYKR